MKPIDLVLKIDEAAPDAWYLRTEGMPDGDHVIGPFRTEAEVRAAQQDLAQMLADLLEITPLTGNPNRN